VRVVSWNLNHRIREKPIPPTLGELFASMQADVVLLNEFVDGPTRATFRESLRSAGFPYQQVSHAPARHNQVFAASRCPFSPGDLEPPSLDGPAIAGFLHIRFDAAPIELVGLRAPAYERATDKHAYWAQLTAIMQAASARPIAFVGDVNRNPFVEAGQRNAGAVRFSECAGFRVPNPTGDWSYMNTDGTKTSRIDHVLHTGAVRIGAPAYVPRFRDWVLAGPASEDPMSDHAALTFTVSRADAGAL